MNLIYKTLVVGIFFSLPIISFGQRKVVEDTIIVKGNCNMCKERIEEAAFGKGVKFAEWNKTTDELAIAYRSDKTSIAEIEKRVAQAGHSTEHVKAEEEDYTKLPECCRYEHEHKH